MTAIRTLLATTRAKVILAGVVVLALAAVVLPRVMGGDTKRVIAYFPLAVHLYPGSDVDVLGVKVGTVTSVTPQATQVKVVMEYDAARRIPAGATAIVDEPTLVADRVIELSPVYGGGPVLADGATIPIQRTGVPLELDQLTGNLVQLAQALGPAGANKTGALGRAIQVGAANMRGEGAQAHTTVSRLAQLMSTIGDNRNALFGTIRNLQAFTSTLAQHDAETRSFTTDLADVSQQLAQESGAFSTALHNLGIALADVSRFIHANRDQLAGDVRQLGTVTQILARERVLLAHIADFGAVGISNYPHMYTPSARTYNARFDNFDTNNPTLFFCQLYDSVGGDPNQCMQMLQPLNKVPLSSGSKR
ncbi:MAG TPA: MCE family protein [Mycobacteriales bacterium]|jgi:phospholipid/cholesterol/gamma-HCH transport system substrate-binding protein|nr:MCE family protein [Mycobacteriales bacterium]